MSGSKKLCLYLLYLAVYSGMYSYLHQSGLWIRYRGTGLMFGGTWAVLMFLLILHWKSHFTNRWHSWLAGALLLAGVYTLLYFFSQSGDSTEGFIAATLIGISAPQIYAFYKSRQLKVPDGTQALR
jgi:hypothetical protein